MRSLVSVTERAPHVDARKGTIANRAWRCKTTPWGATPAQWVSARPLREPPQPHLVAGLETQYLLGGPGVDGDGHLTVAVDEDDDVAGAHGREGPRHPGQKAFACADELDGVAEPGCLELAGAEVERHVAEAVDEQRRGRQAVAVPARLGEFEPREAVGLDRRSGDVERQPIGEPGRNLSLIHISEPTRRTP